MKKYIKPTIEIIELRSEERLAASGCNIKNQGNGVGKVCTYPVSTL